jgi:hypothetical protein
MFCHFFWGSILIQFLLESKHFQVIVAGSATMGTEALSRKTEVYDSNTCTWEVTGDVPGPEYALNEYQTGVVSKNLLLCVGFLAPENDTTTVAKGVLVYDIGEKAWIQHDEDEDEEEQLRWRQQCELPSLGCCRRPASPNYSTQIFECEGSIFVFWEQEHNRTMVHSCVAQLDLSAIISSDDASSVRRAAPNGHPVVRSPWSMVVHDDRVRPRGLLVYPELVSVGHDANKVCIFNSVDLTSSMTYEIGPGGSASKSRPFPKPPPLLRLKSELGAHEKDEMPEGITGSKYCGNNNNPRMPLFFSLNPLSFSFEPSFHTMV